MGMKSLEQYRADFIDVIKRTMATNLTNKGVSASTTESLKALADKIANVNTGKKWASGTVTSDSSGKFQVTGLSFTPSFFIAIGDSATNQGISIGVTKWWPYHSGELFSNGVNFAINFNGNVAFLSNGFMGQASGPGITIKWYAFE
uniref:Uncharacterized protein n=1 Tax=Geobacillus sp. (strain Y4.1MC1) TaxID=581103 RepID=A0A7U3YCV5_GEOS0